MLDAGASLNSNVHTYFVIITLLLFHSSPLVYIYHTSTVIIAKTVRNLLLGSAKEKEKIYEQRDPWKLDGGQIVASIRY